MTLQGEAGNNNSRATIYESVYTGNAQLSHWNDQDVEWRNATYAQDALVNTTQGQVQGALATDGNYYVFYGVHYAGSSSGANRFKVMLV
ncbi:hypothetical protein MSG28_008868 [Choristoneura fumiferana]|uniref:Uncharacterized protein n=1 Tax=Choristoneura fumiferana TaxID=7141 RepID=A0ACC0J8Q2_CHOFU|nr:hypothetical protein MSG28_008868 [Choristoneura fumiferana]